MLTYGYVKRMEKAFNLNMPNYLKKLPVKYTVEDDIFLFHTEIVETWRISLNKFKMKAK